MVTLSGQKKQCLTAILDAKLVVGIPPLCAGMHLAGCGKSDASIRNTAVIQERWHALSTPAQSNDCML